MASKKHQRCSKESIEEEKSAEKMKIASHRKTALESPAVCLFCNTDSGKMEENLKHMNDTHGFNLPYSEQLKDQAAVLRYLAEKIHIGNICLGCNNYRSGSFKNSQAVQQHMMDKGHTFIDLDIFQSEYGNFVKHKDKFLKKRAPLGQRVSAVMTQKELDKLKAEAPTTSEAVMSTSNEYEKISTPGMISLSSSSSVSGEDHKESTEKKIESSKMEIEEDWEDLILKDVKEEDKVPKKEMASSSFSEVSSVSEASSACDEHIMMDTGELLLANGKRFNFFQ